MRPIRYFCFVLFLAAGIQSASGFALLGPFAPWMTAELSYQDGYSIGGPMNIGEGYRWNVPVITYGFDQSFLDYFGTNGVAAVESAIQILNDLPPASQIVLSNFPLLSRRFNYTAVANNLVDLKSTALVLLIGQMGLTQPTRFIFTLHDFSDVNGATNYTTIMRNFDPITLSTSPYVNGTLYGYNLTIDGIPYLNFIENYSALPIGYVDASEVPYNPGNSTVNAVADGEPVAGYGSYLYGNSPVGEFYFGLTRDDVGGLCYLLSTNNIALENLLPGVTGYGANASNFVTTALRPGRDKMIFQSHNYDSLLGKFTTMTNQYVDYYISNGVVQQQALQRVITQPDVLFTAKYDGLHPIVQSGTTNWVNNGMPSHDGPGVIQPPVVINFNQLGPSLYHYYQTPYADANFQPFFNFWGTFDGTTNRPIIYPINPLVTNSIVLHVWLEQLPPQPILDYAAAAKGFSWNLTGAPNQLFLLQTSTNLSDWVTITTITNLGGTFTYFDEIDPNSTSRFFRTVPQ